MPTLEFLNGPRKGERLPVVGDRFVLGRADGCDAVLAEAPHGPAKPRDNISRRHAVITCAAGEWFVTDGDGHGRPSRNGTFLNGRRIPHSAPAPLAPGAEIRLCDVRLAFHLDPDSTFTPEASVGVSDSRMALASQSAERLRTLLDVSIALRDTLDPGAVLDRTLDHLFRMFPQADRGLVVSRDDPTAPLSVRALRTPGGVPTDPGFSTTVIRQCMERTEAVLGNDDLESQFPAADSLGGLSVRSLMCAPLWAADGTALGAVQLDTRADGRKFTADDLHLLWGVACQASVALSNARLHREALTQQARARDLELAHQVQRALLPRTLPAVPAYTFFAHYAAADEVGGDSYDFVPLPGGRLAVLLGDVAGHGVAAALVMARFGAEARACLEAEADLAAAVARMNGLILRADVPDSFVTLAAVVLDPANHAVAVVSAGHPLPLVRRVDGSVEALVSDEALGPPLGVVEGFGYACRAAQLGAGEAVLVFSDGLTEAMDAGDHQFGLGATRAAFAGAGPDPRATVEALAAAVRRHVAGGEQTDDITLVCLARAAG